MNEVSLKDDEYIDERSGKPLVAIIPIETYLNLTGKRQEFFSLYDSLQRTADRSAAVDDDLAEALAAAETVRRIVRAGSLLQDHHSSPFNLTPCRNPFTIRPDVGQNWRSYGHRCIRSKNPPP